MLENGTPTSAMVIVAHPDDAEFGMAGTVAKWASAGCQITYVLCTDGNAGSHEPDMTREAVAEVRRVEQRAACAELGVEQVVFLGHDDGQLEPTMELRRELVAELRKVRPEVAICGDPTRLFVGDGYINHPDHRAAAQAALDAIFPAAQMPLLWPELGEPHRVRQVYVQGNSEPNTWVDISEALGRKIAALKKHASQIGDWDPTERITEWAATVGEEQSLAHAEAYRVMTLVRDEPKSGDDEE